MICSGCLFSSPATKTPSFRPTPRTWTTNAVLLGLVSHLCNSFRTTGSGRTNPRSTAQPLGLDVPANSTALIGTNTVHICVSVWLPYLSSESSRSSPHTPSSMRLWAVDVKEHSCLLRLLVPTQKLFE